jgi:WD40 repeat protein
MHYRILFLISFFQTAFYCSAQPTKVTVFREHGLCVDWDYSGSNRIAYAVKGPDTYYDIHLCDPDGSHDSCLNCNTPGLPQKHVACPEWHPSGKWIVCVAEKEKHPGQSYEAYPGFGGYSDIWVITSDGKKAYRLTDLPEDKDHGIITAFFSPDGKHLTWTERTKRPDFVSLKRTFGFWVIKMADFIETPDGPVLKNIHSLQPGEDAFYESYGFSPDGKRIIFCSSMHKPSAWDEQLYTMDTFGFDVKKLTNSDYNEHGFYSPDGKKIVWMTNHQCTKSGTDWWMMNVDGSDEKRLTFFNEPDSAQCNGKPLWAGLGKFSPDGKRFIGGVQTNLFTQEGKIVMVEFADPPAGGTNAGK